jgi:hypothetical protein
MPFKMTGTMLVTVWRMIFSDVFKWMTVFLFLLFGFATASYVLVVSSFVQFNVRMETEDDLDFWNYVLTYAYVSLGEVNPCKCWPDSPFACPCRKLRRESHIAWMLVSIV